MKTLYEKRGRKYVPVAEERVWDSYPDGCHLVVVAPGRMLRRFNIASGDIGLAAAVMAFESQLADIIVDASKARPSGQALTEAQRKAWASLNKTMGGLAYIEYPSACEIARTVLAAITAKRI